MFCVRYWVLVCVICFSALAGAAPGDSLARAIAQLPLNAPVSVARLYGERPQALWSNEHYQQLLLAVEGSAADGLSPDDYHYRALVATDTPTAQRDVLASDAYLSLAAHLLAGKLDPVSIEVNWTAKGRQRDLVAHLQRAMATQDIGASLRELLPSQPRYQLLKAALQHYRQIDDSGSWPTVADGALLKPGARSPRIAALRARLQRGGDLPYYDAPAEAEVYDAELVAALKRFQRRANLEPDGIVGPATVRELNRSPGDRIEQLRVNLERWRWLPDDLGAKHIRVNIADYQLEVHQGAQITDVHDVVVGRTYRQTPVFSATMSYLVLNPWWETPATLARTDILKKFQADPKQVDLLGYQVLGRDGRVVDHSQINWRQYSARHFPFRLRQKPGPSNALGAVKFMFPNAHEVYLHDTPSRELFAKTRRDFSSGCIRVKDPVDLAQWVLAGNGDWPRSRIDSVLALGKETSVSLRQRIPVHLLYWTAVANQEGDGVRFIEDIYERDARVLAALNQPPVRR